MLTNNFAITLTTLTKNGVLIAKSDLFKTTFQRRERNRKKVVDIVDVTNVVFADISIIYEPIRFSAKNPMFPVIFRVTKSVHNFK